MAANPKSGKGKKKASATATPSPSAATTPPASPAATTSATTATTTAAATAPSPTTGAASTPDRNKGKITRLHIGPTGPWHDEDGNSCLIWTPRGYNLDDDAVSIKIHLVADRQFFMYPVGTQRSALPQQSYDISIKKTPATSYMIVVTTRGSLEIDVTVPSRRLSIENIRMPGARRESITLELVFYAFFIVLGLYLFGWRFASIAGGVAATVFITTLLCGTANAIWRWQGRGIREALAWIFASDNRLWLVWSLMCIIATGVAITHPGSGLIAPAIYEAEKNAETVAHEERIQKFHNLSRGHEFKSDRELGKPTKAPSQPRSWQWFWLNSYFWLVWWVMIVPTFADDARAIMSRVWQKTWRSFGGEASLVSAWSVFTTALRRQKISVPRRAGTEQATSAGEIGSNVFWSSLWANLITEFPSIIHALIRR